MEKQELIIYEGAMCCSTGLCGPEPDKKLIELNEAIKKLQREFDKLTIKRASITHNINMFLENKEIFELVKKQGQKILPITTLNGKIIAKENYLSYEELKEILSGKEIKKIIIESEETSDKPEGLCCADKNVCDIRCAPRENLESNCGCGGNC